MSTIQDEIQECIEAFCEDLAQMVREEAMESFQRALAGDVPQKTRSPRTVVQSPKEPSSGKRSPEEIRALADRLQEFVGDNPGLGVEQIAQKMQLQSKELVLSIRRLVQENRLRTEGQKRATKYFLAAPTQNTAAARLVRRRRD